MSFLQRACSVGVVALGLMAWAPTAVASPGIQKLLGKAPTADKNEPAVTSPAERRAEIERQLEATQAEAAAVAAGKRPVPAGATPAQLGEIASLLERMPTWLQAQLDVLRELDSARSERAEAEEALATWKDFDQPGPYTLTQYTALLDQLDAERTRIKSFESVQSLQQGEIQRVEVQLKERQAAERLALEKAAGASTAPLELARLQARRAAEVMRLLTVQGELNAELLQAVRARVALLERQAAAMSANYRFTERELEQVLSRLQTQQASIERRIEDASVAQGRAQMARDAARKALESLAEPTSAEAVRQRAEQQARLDAAQVTVEALRTELSALTTLRGIVPLGVIAWKQRYQVMSGPDADARRAAEKGLDEMLDRGSALQSFAADLGNLADTLLLDQQRRVQAMGVDAPGRRYGLDALQAASRSAEAVREVKAASQQLANAQSRWRKQHADALAQRPFAERAADAWAVVKGYAGTVWNFELFVVEDTVNIGGRATTVERSVTVGKSIGALLIFLGGYALAGALSRRLQRLMVARFAVGEPQARVLRRWMMLLTGFALLVITLNLARIPLTVFAFLGGALAIGIGFGTQTLLKNFISGIIVLFERKVRVGDIVDVEGVQGIVTAVDIRSTTVKQFDGIETMVPNAMLLENKVTNWTGESPVMRRVVKVGVAYGSPTRQVAEIMVQVAAEHGQVLKEPAPYVIFEDFGDNALLFALYFWVDVIRHSGTQVASDMRFMLEKRFAEAGISIPFPQRDMHLDSARPLQVELMRGPLAVRAT
jgi:small-conductance mechanosensitive channel